MLLVILPNVAFVVFLMEILLFWDARGSSVFIQVSLLSHVLANIAILNVLRRKS